MINENFNLDLPFPDIFPKEWKKTIGPKDFVSFRNLDHFKHTVSQLTQRTDDMCGMSYKEALQKLLKDESDFPPAQQAELRNLVRSNLFKRGLITEEVYENYRYSVEGTQVGIDIGKYAAGEADCVIVPSHQYIDYFYELYISISYPYTVTNEAVRENTAKLLATIEELERQHVFIKITLVFPGSNCGQIENRPKQNFFSSIPLFSHKEKKSVATMSAILNDRLLRKFYFAILEDIYKDKISYGYGYPMDIYKVMNIGNTFNEIKFFESVLNEVGKQ